MGGGLGLFITAAVTVAFKEPPIVVIAQLNTSRHPLPKAY
jgi:hypothetical protein